MQTRLTALVLFVVLELPVMQSSAQEPCERGPSQIELESEMRAALRKEGDDAVVRDEGSLRFVALEYCHVGCICVVLSGSPKPPSITGKDIESLSVEFEKGVPTAFLHFTEEGSKKLENLTSANVEQNLLVKMGKTVLATQKITSKFGGGVLAIPGLKEEDAVELVKLFLHKTALQ